MENEQSFGHQPPVTSLTTNEQSQLPVNNEPQVPQPQYEPTPTFPKAPTVHQPSQALPHPTATGPLPRAASNSAPQTPMMEIEPTGAPINSIAQMVPAQGVPAGHPSQAAVQPERPLNVTDALSYLDAVKVRFQDRPDVYNHFLDIMKDFKTSAIDTPGVIERVSHLFNSHPDLIQGFNTFLPPGYRIETGNDGSIMVRTPQGTTHIPPYSQAPPPQRAPQLVYHPNAPNAHAIGMSSQQAPYHMSGANEATTSTAMGMMSQTGSGGGLTSPTAYPPPAGPAIMHDVGMQPSRSNDPAVNPQIEFQRAIAYVNKIKNRFAGDPDTYKTFLELLGKFQQGNGNPEVQQQIESLFKGTPDLLIEFKDFLPEGGGGSFIGSVVAAAGNSDWASNKRKEASSTLPAPPAKRKKKVEKELPPKPTQNPSRQQKKAKYPRERTPDYYLENGAPIPGPHMGMGASTADDQAFFEKVKRTLDNRETYDEFLKLINLFSQDIIDMRTLVDKSNYFLVEGSDLSIQFRRIIGWEDRERLFREPDDPSAGGLKNLAIYVPHNKDDLHHKCGPSYRRIPANEAHIACSGRDELCRSVLNDEWVSHPTWASEDNSGFQSHKKNAYEEALHKCEEERHEFDFHLEIMGKTISALENINMKIQQMSNEEKSTFKLKPGLGLPNKSIYQRIVKKVYGKEPGMEVIATLHDCPAIAVPIVLSRLKAKDEDWRRAQREWNKVWREVDARNFYKSLDHQGVTFKSSDKKAMTTKALVATIEAARDEQLSERAKLIDASLARTRPTHHLAYKITDMAVVKDATKLVLAYLDRLGPHYTVAERDKIETWLLEFVVLFFVLDKADFESGLKDTTINQGGALGVTNMVPAEEGTGMELDVEEPEETPSGRRTPSRGKNKAGAAGVNSSDLRKKLLSKSAGGTAAGSRTHSAKNSPAVQPAELPTVSAFDVSIKQEETMPVDSVWIAAHVDPSSIPTLETQSSPPNGNKSPAANRKTTFFANTIPYVVLRIFQTLYARLLNCKEITAKLSEYPESHVANPVAYELGLLDGLGPGTMNLFAPANEGETNPDGSAINTTSRFYDHLLECCESLFAGDLDQNTFEENLRFMFGTKAYLMFTIDKVIAALIKQVHTAITDPHTEELLILLRKERMVEKPTTQQIITYRRSAEEIIGQDDNLFRINWNDNIMTMQLLGKSDPSTDDAETLAQRWRLYIESYVLTHPTEGVRRDVKNPFLRRNIIEAPLTETGCHAHNGLEIKVCIRTYRLFFGSNTEDCFWRFGDGARKQAMEKLPGIEEKRKERFESWLEAKRTKKEKGNNSTKKTDSPLVK